MSFQIKKATKTQARLRLALIGPSGSGKTFTALRIAMSLGKPVCLIDSERKSASKYAGVNPGDGAFEFDVLELDSFEPDTYVAAIDYVSKSQYGTLIIDSLSHAWMGKGGALEQVDRAAKRMSGNSFGAWRDVTPMHNRLVDSILAAPMHVIATMRTKTDWVIEEDGRGKKVPKKIGLAPVQRDGLDYEFDVVGDMNLDNELIVGKTRCPALAGKVYKHPGKDVADLLGAWLTDGAPAPAETAKPASVPPPASPPSLVAEHAAKVETLKAAIEAAKTVGTEDAKKALIDTIKAADLPAAAMGEVRKAYAAAFPPVQAAAS